MVVDQGVLQQNAKAHRSNVTPGVPPTASPNCVHILAAVDEALASTLQGGGPGENRKMHFFLFCDVYETTALVVATPREITPIELAMV